VPDLDSPTDVWPLSSSHGASHEANGRGASINGDSNGHARN
ncbi:hypothetical protein A2U01_0024033, partial [Trifolium medium]|nr:hypothetical protein [Trifolium medium]